MMFNLKKLLELIIAIVISTIVYPVGMLFNIFNSRAFDRSEGFIKYYLGIAKEGTAVVFQALEGFAIVLDILGNVIGGRLFFVLFTDKKDRNAFTYFGKRGWTISASTGHLFVINKLNKRGIKFLNFLTFALREDNHCLNAYYYKLHKLNYKKIK